jgi:TolB-like protein
MSEKRSQRRLAAILAADVVGYSRLMEQDEAGTWAALKARRQDILVPLVAQHNGRVVKLMGDGVLVEFGSPVDAVQCAVELQRGFAGANQGVPEAQRIFLRIGINLGDVIVEGSDIYGDGVNVAARLEGLAESGGILVSANVHEHVIGKLALPFDDLGDHALKNIVKPVRVYRAGTGENSEGAARPALTLPDKPSIAVLPFQNMSGDPEQEYFADGMVEDIITGLSRFNALFVIARNSSFSYKGRAVDIRQIGRELGVRYVLEGSVRKAGDRVRITGQLIDTSTGRHLWADRFEGMLEDVFDLQDQVTASVVGAIAPKLEQVEIERIKRKPTDRLDAYDCFLRGMMGFYKWSKDGSDEALAYFYKAFAIDPSYAAAYGMVARVYVQRNAGGWMVDRVLELAEAERTAKKAAILGQDDAVALSAAGLAFSDMIGLTEDGDALIDRAISLNPNLASAWLNSSWIKSALGEPVLALERIERAQRLSPNDPNKSSFYAAKAYAQVCAARYAEAYSSAEAAIRERPGFLLYECIAAASSALAGKVPNAEKIAARILQINPALRLSNVSTLIPLHRLEYAKRWEEGLRMAGIPE